MNVLIVGCGTFGKSLITILSGFTHPPYIIVIDRNQEAFEDLPIDFHGFLMVGDAANIALLEEAKIKNVSMFISVTNNDNINLMLAQIAKDVYHVPEVIASVSESDLMQMGKFLGITIINPMERAARDLLAPSEIFKEGSK